LPETLTTPAASGQVIDRFQEVLVSQTQATLERSGPASDRAWRLARVAAPQASRQIEARHEQRRLVARFYVDRGLFIEQAAWFEESELPPAELDTFLDGLQPS
jgi:hypothetical protein